MSDRLTPEREVEIAERRYTLRSIASTDVDIDALLAELAAVRAERDQARVAALNEAADHFDRMADFESDQGYRARIMRGAARDIRRLAATPTAEEAS